MITSEMYEKQSAALSRQAQSFEDFSKNLAELVKLQTLQAQNDRSSRIFQKVLYSNYVSLLSTHQQTTGDYVWKGSQARRFEIRNYALFFFGEITWNWTDFFNYRIQLFLGLEQVVDTTLGDITVDIFDVIQTAAITGQIDPVTGDLEEVAVDYSSVGNTGQKIVYGRIDVLFNKAVITPCDPSGAASRLTIYA